eukprot:CAMPEP_0173329622 /NCGR_PEP_ID=MMETSP1144-20121109/2809_1 /TAXON_ID=483371 /ORGANISM="non described non described, Strain CCMP2298" /LENGTH=171 /DNA_ID=CAMNT_0014274235 /DNA_START=41 /DNA_END=553 /DNA_ORIENTATION=+
MEYYILMIILIERYGGQARVMDRELQDHLYCPSAYLASHLLSSLPLLLAQPVFYSLPIYLGANLRPGLPHLLTFLACNVLLALVVNGLAWMCVSLFRDFAAASLLANTNFTFISLTEYADRTMDGCESPDAADCTQFDGDNILESQDIGTYSLVPWLALGGLCLAYHGVAL